MLDQTNTISQKTPPVQQHIHQAALACFSRKGYKGAKVAEIAHEADISPALIYRYYDGKRALFESLQRPDLDFPDPQFIQRKREIERAALAVFSRKGYASTTMDEIADAVGLTKAGLYAYYTSKEALFESTLSNPEAFERLERSYARDLKTNPTNAREAMRHIAENYLDMFTRFETCQLLRIVISEGVRDPKIAAAFRMKIILCGSSLVSSYLAKLGYGKQEDLVLKVQSFFGMLFSWMFPRYLLAGGEEIGVLERDLMLDTALGMFFNKLEEQVNSGEPQ
jgi:AcrR family transcriptional regulator